MLLPFRPSSHRKPGLFAAHSSIARREQRKAALRRRPLLEDLEGRQMLSTIFTVKNTNDSGTNSLPWAIAQANNTTGPITIDFNISDPADAVETIQLQSPLPAITVPMTIDGLSENTYIGDTSTAPLIRIDGAKLEPGAFGLDITNSASGSASNPTVVSGLQITDFSQAGVFIDAASYVTLQDLFVGVTTASGNLVDAGNSGFGVEFYQGSNDTLEGSVVSANNGDGVLVSDAAADMLTGDFIGTDMSGESSMDSNGKAWATPVSAS